MKMAGVPILPGSGSLCSYYYHPAMDMAVMSAQHVLGWSHLLSTVVDACVPNLE